MPPAPTRLTSAEPPLAYWVLSCGQGAWRPAALPDALQPGETLCEVLASAVSPGTERLVGTGGVSEDAMLTMACPYMDGAFPFPVKYGYAVVAQGVDGALAGQRFFALHPHQTHMVIRDADAVVLPRDVPSLRGSLYANLETALNGWWDGAVSADEPVLVVGGGVVGSLLAFVAHRFGHPVTLVDADPQRRALAARFLPTCEVEPPESVHSDRWRVAFHTSGNPRGLELAMKAVRFEGRVVELSWYGTDAISVRLDRFHWNRLHIVSSQVGTVALPRRIAPDDGRTERRAAVLELLSAQELDRIIPTPLSWTELPDFMGRVYSRKEVPVHPVFVYPPFARWDPTCSVSPSPITS